MRAPWLFGHIGLKLLSAGLAVMLWMIVSGEETVERSLRVPLEFQQFPAGLELEQEMPPTVDVRVRGGSGTLSRLSPTDVVAVLGLHGARPGRQLFHLTADQVRVPFGVEVTQVTPASIALVFETMASRQVPVAPAVEGKPAPGFVIDTITADPSVVEVIGPESAVKRVTEAITETISVTDARETVRETVSVGFLEPSLRLKYPRGATVTIDIAPAPAERVVRGRPIHLENLAPNLSARAIPAVVNVTLRGNRDPLNRAAADDITASVDLTGLGNGEYTLTVKAVAPGDIGVMAVVPPTVQVLLR